MCGDALEETMQLASRDLDEEEVTEGVKRKGKNVLERSKSRLKVLQQEGAG